ncbi:Photosystem I assembly protein Ycf3 [bacterium HR33]|nr:Photosystem I assembly protein Ycf3 [bacterium HR33]
MPGAGVVSGRAVMAAPSGSARSPGSRATANRRSRWLWLMLGIAVLAGGVGALLLLYRLEPIELPPPRGRPSAPQIAAGDYAGADACRDCHAVQYDAWRRSTHGRAGGPPNRETVIARFDGSPIRFRDAVVTPFVTPRGEYAFRVVQEGGREVVFTVAGVIGRGHMVGGGTQGFVTRWIDGTYRFLPFDFSRHQGVWFCNTVGRADSGWVPITPQLSIAACSDWPPRRVLGTEARFSNCQECHGSGIDLELDPASRRYSTEIRSFTIDCESCHGPARRHVELARAGTAGTNADIGVRSLGILDKDRSLEVCFSCHAVKDVLREGYRTGAPLKEHYSLGLALVGDNPLFPDGRVKTFAYQEGHRFSDCYLNGSMTCTDCHEPHGQGYRDIWGNSLPSRFDDGQCLDCHASKSDRVAEHTKHAPGSPGSRCVSCHMPYLQQPQLGNRIRYARSDHTISIPRPSLDARLGIEGACVQCHREWSREAVALAIDTLWGELKPLPAGVAALLDSGADWERLLDVLDPGSRHSGALAMALGELLQRLAPDTDELDGRLLERLRSMARVGDLDVRALALAALHLAAGERRSVRRLLREALEDAGDEEWLLRDRWKVALAFVADSYRERGEARQAAAVYRKALEIAPGDPAVLHNLGLALANAGDLEGAVANYRLSLQADPRQPLVLVNLGIALQGMGDAAGAIEAYRRALEINSEEPLAHFNLGNMYLRQGQIPEAITQYRRALAVDPGLPLAHFNLARAYVAAGDLRAALDAVRRGLEFAPEDSDGRQMELLLRQELGLR